MTGGVCKEERQIEGAVEVASPWGLLSTTSVEGFFPFFSHLQSCV
jgi:hypothetical protein